MTDKVVMFPRRRRKLRDGTRWELSNELFGDVSIYPEGENFIVDHLSHYGDSGARLGTFPTLKAAASAVADFIAGCGPVK